MTHEDIKNIEEIEEKIKNFTDAWILEIEKPSWSEEASAFNEGWCCQCDGMSNACRLDYPCQWNEFIRKEIELRGLK